MVASDIAPVREVIRDGENGIAVDFFDGEALLQRTLEVLGEQQPSILLRRKVCNMHEYSVAKGVQGYMREIRKLMTCGVDLSETAERKQSI